MNGFHSITGGGGVDIFNCLLFCYFKFISNNHVVNCGGEI